MKKLALIAALVLSSLTHTQAQDVSEIIDSVIEAMGGTEAWQDVDYISMKHVGHKHWLEQSENPNGPYITSYEVVEEVRSVSAVQLYKKVSSHMFQSTTANSSEMMVNATSGIMKFGDRSFPMPYQLRGGHEEWMSYAPERLIFDARKAESSFEGEQFLDGTDHLVVSYTINELKRTLYINKHTRVLTQAGIETHLPYDLFNYPWGKFTTTVKFSLHWLYPGGFRYPAQWDVFKLGKKLRSTTIIDIDFKPEVNPDIFTIPKDLPPTPVPVLVNDLPLNTDGIKPVAEHVKTIPGQWYVGHIEQEDGILVIEAPISSGYNEQHLVFLREQYPNKPIKAVFATSDAWPHIGGIRAFAANKTPIYTHELNEQIIRSVLKADHALLPDAYEQRRPKPKFRLITETLIIDDPQAPVQVIPVNGEGGERMIMLYLPKQKVLYASDLIQYNGRSKTFFSPQYLSEVKKVVDMHELEVETVFAMHTSPMPWQQVLDALKQMIK